MISPRRSHGLLLVHELGMSEGDHGAFRSEAVEKAKQMMGNMPPQMLQMFGAQSSAAFKTTSHGLD